MKLTYDQMKALYGPVAAQAIEKLKYIQHDPKTTKLQFVVASRVRAWITKENQADNIPEEYLVDPEQFVRRICLKFYAELPGADISDYYIYRKKITQDFDLDNIAFKPVKKRKNK